MRIGEWELCPVISGMFRLDGGAMFGVVPKNLWERVAPSDDANRISMAMRTLVIKGHGKTIVVDTGAGRGYGEKFEKIYAFADAQPLADALKKARTAPGDVTDVIISHLHFDHGGGAAVPDDGGWRLAFPNAAHHVQKTQWEHALNPNSRDRASYFRDRIEFIEKKGVLALHDGAWTLGPGLEMLVYDGHTPGQQLPKISDGEKTLFYGGDLIPMAAHIPIPYIMAYDLQPVLSMAEKTHVLEKASREGWYLFFEHDPRIEACRVGYDGNRFTMVEEILI